MRAETTTAGLPSCMWGRTRVLLIAYGVLLVVAGGLAVPPAAGTMDAIRAFATVAAGWLAPLVIDPDHWSMGLGGWLIAVANLVLLVAHPVRPCAGTAVLTVLGVVIWLFFGLAVATVGV